MDWNYVWCQTILLFYQEVLGTVGAFSNFRCVTVRGRGLWQELLRGRESIRQGSLQSGQLLKMQQHHYSLTEPATPVSFTASLFILDRYLFFFFFWILFATAICSLFDMSPSHPFFASILPSPSLLHIFFYYKTGRGELLSPLCAWADPLKLFHSYLT